MFVSSFFPVPVSTPHRLKVGWLRERERRERDNRLRGRAVHVQRCGRLWRSHAAHGNLLSLSHMARNLLSLSRMARNLLSLSRMVRMVPACPLTYTLQ